MLPLLVAAALAEPPPLPDLTGTYRLDLRISSTADIPVLGDAQIQARTTILATISPDGSGGFTQHHTTCRINPVSSIKIAQTSIPQSFIDPMPDKVYPVQLSPLPDGTWAYSADFGPQYIGFDPEKSGNMPPSEPDHPAVIDWEGDGHPGATIHLQAPVFGQVEVYITQLAHTRVSGVRNANGVVTGGVDVLALEQRSIAAKPGIFASNPKVTQQPGLSRFTLTPVAAGSTCADLLK